MIQSTRHWDVNKALVNFGSNVTSCGCARGMFSFRSGSGWHTPPPNHSISPAAVSCSLYRFTIRETLALLKYVSEQSYFQVITSAVLSAALFSSLWQLPCSGLPGFLSKTRPLLLKTCPKCSPIAFQGDPLVNPVFRWLTYTFFGGVYLVKFAFQGLPQPADMKNLPRKEC